MNIDERLKFRGQKVEVQGHGGIKYAGNIIFRVELSVLYVSTRRLASSLEFLVFFYYRAMHFSAFARSCDRMSSVRPSVRL